MCLASRDNFLLEHFWSPKIRSENFTVTEHWPIWVPQGGGGQGFMQEQALRPGRPSLPRHEAEQPDCPVPRPSGLQTAPRPHRGAGERETPASCVCACMWRRGGPPVQGTVGPCFPRAVATWRDAGGDGGATKEL